MRRLATITSLLLVCSSSILAAPIYKWVDAQGTTHFGSEPPANQKVESINTKVFQPPVPEKTAGQAAAEEARKSSNTQADIDREVRKQIAEEEKALIRYNLAQLENNPRVLADIDGTPTRLSEEERQARIAEIKTAINERCTDIK